MGEGERCRGGSKSAEVKASQNSGHTQLVWLEEKGQKVGQEWEEAPLSSEELG